MADPFVGQIMMIGFNFAPRGWAFCNGQILQISTNTALFSLIGTAYGGDGRTTFGLPNLQGRFPMHQGQGPGLSHRVLGQAGGEERVTLTQTQMPVHSHNANLNLNVSVTSSLKAVSGLGSGVPDPAGNSLSNAEAIYKNAAPDQVMNAASVESTVSDAGSGVAVGSAGGSQPHDNMPPFQVVNFVIALQGLYPSRN